MTFDAEAFVKEEQNHLSILLDRLEQVSIETRQFAAEALTLAAAIAADKLEGKSTDVAEDALKAVKANILAAARIQTAHVVFGYIEGAIIRVAATVGRILVGL